MNIHALAILKAIVKCQASCLGMQAENTVRADCDMAPAYDMEAFQNEMRKANADWQMNYYSNAVHAFTHKDAGSDNSKGAAYNEKADKRSWIAFIDFLKEVL